MSENTEQLYQQWLNDKQSLTQLEQAQLLSLGLDIFRPIEGIDKHRIQSAIDFSHIDVVFSSSSTQQAVNSKSTLIAEHQSAGVGQRGKSWLTPLGAAVCLSQRFVLPVPLSHMQGYTLTVALACLQTIKHFDPQAAVSIKWPNDLYCHGVKFAGILTQVQPKSEQQTEVTLGIGLNWQLGPQHFSQVDQAVCNVPLNTREVSRNDFIIQLLKQIHQNNQSFCQHGFAAFNQAWQPHDHLTDQVITLNTSHGQYQGIYAGISPQGAIQVNCNGELKCFASGEAQIAKKHV